MKGTLTGVWILAVVVVGYVLGATSLAAWAILAAVAVAAPLVMMRLWRVPAKTTSESIRESLR